MVAEVSAYIPFHDRPCFRVNSHTGMVLVYSWTCKSRIKQIALPCKVGRNGDYISSLKTKDALMLLS